MLLTGGVNYSWDYFFETGDSLYVSADASVPLQFLPCDIAPGLHAGHRSIEDNARFGAPDYYGWSAGISGKVQGFALAVTYVDTDIKKSECFPGSGLTRTCEGRAVFSISRSFRGKGSGTSVPLPQTGSWPSTSFAVRRGSYQISRIKVSAARPIG